VNIFFKSMHVASCMMHGGTTGILSAVSAVATWDDFDADADDDEPMPSDSSFTN
jgi:hypothetical protein